MKRADVSTSGGYQLDNNAACPEESRIKGRSAVCYDFEQEPCGSLLRDTIIFPEALQFLIGDNRYDQLATYQ